MIFKALQEGTTPSPEGIPSEPTFPRAFVEFGNRLNKKDIFVTFRVQAHNEVGAGPYTKFINVSTTNENPVPLLLVSSFNGVRILDMDLQIDFELNVNDIYIEIVYSALEHKFYGITQEKIMTWDFNTNAIATKPNFTEIVDLYIPPHSLCIDWIARNLYWMEHKTIKKLDLTLLQMGKVKYDNILKTEEYTSFNVLPSKGKNIYLYDINEGLIYSLEKKYALLKSKEIVFKRVHKVHTLFNDIYTFLSLDKSLQPYPSTRCLIPNMKDYHVEEKTITANSIAVSLPEPIPNDGCEKYNLATTIYNISVNYLTCLDNDLNKSEEFNVQTYERHYEFQNLTPFTEYTLKLALSNFYVDKLSMDLQFGTDVKLTTTGKLNAPENVTIRALTPTLAAVYWMPPKKLNCVAVKYEVHWMQFLNSTQKKPFLLYKYTKIIDKPEHTLDGKFFTIIQSLLPKQKYEIYVSVYPTNFRNFFTESLPKTVYISEPNDLILNGVSTNGMNISWIPSANLTIHTGLHYILEYKDDAMREWQIANNTKKNNDKVSYYIDNLLPRTKYKFRLILRYLEYIKDFIWTPDGKKFTFETLAYRQRRESNKIILPPIMTDIELATLNEMPSGNVQLNALYVPKSQYNLDKFALTIIEKKQITLGKFLGSGAFGKVHQGILKDFEGSDTMHVAIKMLRKNATSREKIEFLEEANLMSDLRHKHVLRLLGICLYADLPWLILELMEAGDLLKYLRENRTLLPSDRHALRLQDLLAMCEDVARGCCYLEEQRFVHRDLACRNCLISARNRKNRIVKIGDFGLARDIYKDDYYRMVNA
ncbi:proto-oncogene tyrosine-protein kinase ros, partial [Lasius niger]